MSTKAWRFVELGRRLDFLLAGFGWCRMPEHLVAPHLAEGRLVRLPVGDDPSHTAGTLTLHASRIENRFPGRAGTWLLDDLKARAGSAHAGNGRHGRPPRIRAKLSPPPVAVLTAVPTSDNTIEAMWLGAADHLAKPIGRVSSM